MRNLEEQDEEVDQNKFWRLFISQEKVQFTENAPANLVTVYSLYIYNEIADAIEYAELFDTFRRADPGDIINIYINSPGGNLDTLVSFCSVLDETEAIVYCYVDGAAYSAAFILACAGDTSIFSDFSFCMAHNIQGSIFGADYANIGKSVLSSKTIYESMLKRYCLKILTEQEIESIILHGSEVHLTGKECQERMKNNVQIESED